MAGNAILRRVTATYGAHRYAILFYLLLLTFVANPLLATLGPRGHGLDVFVGLNLIAAGLGIRTRRGWLLALVGVVALLAVVEGVARAGLGALAFVLWALVALLAAVTAVRFTLRDQDVGVEQIYAALSAYLLTGLFFGAIHWSIEETWSGSYATATGAPVTVSTAIYFSFVTLATVGYGDVVPTGEVSRGAAMMEALAGQLYLVVMVARLVSLYVMRR